MDRGAQNRRVRGPVATSLRRVPPGPRLRCSHSASCSPECRRQGTPNAAASTRVVAAGTVSGAETFRGASYWAGMELAYPRVGRRHRSCAGSTTGTSGVRLTGVRGSGLVGLRGERRGMPTGRSRWRAPGSAPPTALAGCARCRPLPFRTPPRSAFRVRGCGGPRSWTRSWPRWPARGPGNLSGHGARPSLCPRRRWRRPPPPRCPVLDGLSSPPWAVTGKGARPSQLSLPR